MTLYLSQLAPARAGRVYAAPDDERHIGVWWATQREPGMIRVHLFGDDGLRDVPLPDFAEEGMTAVEVA